MRRNECDAGWPPFCPCGGPRLPPQNLAENRKAAYVARRLARPPAFQLFAKRLKCLNLFQHDEPSNNFFFISSPFFSFHGTSREVLVLAVSPNVNQRHDGHTF